MLLVPMPGGSRKYLSRHMSRSIWSATSLRRNWVLRNASDAGPTSRDTASAPMMRMNNPKLKPFRAMRIVVHCIVQLLTSRGIVRTKIFGIWRLSLSAYSKRSIAQAYPPHRQSHLPTYKLELLATPVLFRRHESIYRHISSNQCLFIQIIEQFNRRMKNEVLQVPANAFFSTLCFEI